MLKHMLKKVMENDGKNWDQLLPHILFTIRKVRQASNGLSPFKLLYGRRPRGLLDIARDAWKSQSSDNRPRRTGAGQMAQVVREHHERAQQAQARVPTGEPGCAPLGRGNRSCSPTGRDTPATTFAV